MKNTNILIVGVGGQGNLLSSRVLGNVAMKVGLDVKISEVHGMAQRGGSIVTYLKMGKKVHSPIIEPGECDVLIAFEELEAVRWSNYLKKDGVVYVNMQRITPSTVSSGKLVYPDNNIERLSSVFTTIQVEAVRVAKELGNMRVVNMNMLGVYAKSTDIAKSTWIEAISETIAPKVLDINLQAFEMGFRA